MKDYRLVIFDWDGTIMDSEKRIVSCVQNAARIAGAAIPTAHAAKSIIGLSLKVAVEALFPKLDSVKQEEIAFHYRDQYVNHDKTPTPLFEGALVLFDELKSAGMQLAVATGKTRAGLDRVWQHFDVAHHFVSSRCACEARSKPHPEMLESLLAELNIEKHQAVMIGDTSFDMEMAKNAGIDRIGVSMGVHDNSVLEQFSPLVIVNSLPELKSHLI